MQVSIAREPSNRPAIPNETDQNMFLKKSTIRDNSNQNNIRYNNMNDTRSPIKLTSQMIMSPNLMEENTKKPLTNNNYNNNYYREEPFSQSFNVEAERQNRLSYERRRDYENPKEVDPSTQYYYKRSRSPSDINDYNNRYTYNYRRDFDYIDFNKLSHSQQLEKRNNMMMDINNNLKYCTPNHKNNERYEKPFEGPTPPSRQKFSFEPYLGRKGSDMEPFYKYKNVEYYGQRDPEVFGYAQVDDRYRHYSPFRNDYMGSRYGSYTYNYYLNAPMRGDISEDFRYPPQYYYKPKEEEIKQGKVFTNLF